MILKTLTYQDHPVTFEYRMYNTLINATEMGKIFDKHPSEFINLPSTQAYILKMEARYPVYNSKIGVHPLRVENEGNKDKEVIWIDAHLALEFAKQLSPEFHEWINSKIYPYKSKKTPNQYDRSRIVIR